MSWNTLSKRAQQLGFKLSYRTRTDYQPDMATPPEADGSWLCLGSYEHVAGLWLAPLTDEARRLPREHIRSLLEDCDPFIETVGDYDSDFFAASAPGRAAVDHPECGIMPA